MVENERRRAARHNVVVPIELSTGSSLSLYACENLSLGGAFFRQAIPFQVGTKVGVSLILPGDLKPIRCQGEIVNVPAPNEFGMGVKFIDLPADDQERIERFGREVATERKA